MVRIKFIILLLGAFFIPKDCRSQSATLQGEIKANAELEGIHVLNITAEEYTVTNDAGLFKIYARVNDTILISSVQYIQKKIIVSNLDIDTKFLSIRLEDRVNELDEVILGRVLTGDLSSDIENSDAKPPINFYDVGIPGYTGKPKTQKERRLLDADGGKYVYYYGLIATINIHKILNKLSGRTKALKKLVRLEAQDKCMNNAMAEFSEELFGHIEIEAELKTIFFYYASEDSKFLEVCEQDNELQLFEFLIEKLLAFNTEVETKD